MIFILKKGTTGMTWRVYCSPSLSCHIGNVSEQRATMSPVFFWVLSTASGAKAKIRRRNQLKYGSAFYCVQGCAIQSGKLTCGETAAQTKWEESESTEHLFRKQPPKLWSCDHAYKDTTFPVLGWGLGFFVLLWDCFCFALGFFYIILPLSS